jgi:hypothetical protein
VTGLEPIEAIGALNAAIAKAQGEFPAIKRERTVDTGSYSYSYASLDKILDSVRGPLSANGLALVQLLSGDGLRTELRHAEGGVIGSTFPLPTVPGKVQEIGSLLTYLRRYAVLAILSLAPEEDDDDGAKANAAAPAVDAERVRAEPSVTERKITDAQNKKIAVLLKELEEKHPTQEGQLSWVAQAREHGRVASRSELTVEGASALIDWLEAQKEAMETPF